MILSWREVYHNYNSGTCDGAAYEKFDDGERRMSHTEGRRHGEACGGGDCLAQSRRGRRVEVPFDLPTGWAWCRVSDATVLKRGKYITRNQIRQGTIPVILGGQEPAYYCDESNHDGPCVVVSRSGASAGFASYWDKPIFVTDGFLFEGIGDINTRYLYFWLKSFPLGRLQRGTGIPHVRAEALNSLLFPLPPLAEQKRIVAKIEELFAVADALGTAAEVLGESARRLDRKILDLAIRGKLVPQDPDDGPASELLKRMSASSHKSPCKNHGKPINLPFVIPQSWKWVRLGDVSNIVRGSGIKRNETSASGVQCVRYGEIYTHYGESFDKAISFVPQTVADKCHEAKFGDVLCTLTGENEVEIAKATAYLGHEKLVIGGDLARISDHPYVPMLLVYFMYSPFMISQKSSVCTGGMIVHMGKAALSNLYIPLPPLAEQKRIVAKIEELRSMITVLSI